MAEVAYAENTTTLYEGVSDTERRQNIWRFQQPFQMPGGYLFDHVKTLRTIDLYYNSKFESGDTDEQNFYKFFYNIVKPACDVATKFIDLDTKDIILISDGGEDEFRIWLLQHDLRFWLKNNDIASLLNEIATDLPKYGSVVIKKAGGKWYKVNLHNIRFDAAMKNLESSDFVYELIQMTPRQMKDMPGWNAEAIQTLSNRKKENSYIVYDCYDYNPTSYFKWRRTVKSDLFTRSRDTEYIRTVEAKINERGSTGYVDSVLLYEDFVTELPYREVHFEKITGRWLSLGFIEYLIPNQIRRNELVNVQAKAMWLNALKIYQTRDEGVGRNVMTDMDFGDIIKTSDPLTLIDTQERNLAYFTEEKNDWDKNKVEKTFTTDISRGENLPSRTPLGVANLQVSMVTSYFEKKREDFGIFLRKWILNDILPSFQKEMQAEHKIMFSSTDDDIGRLDETISRAHVWKESMRYAEETGFFPTQEEIDRERNRIKQEMRSRRGRHLSAPAGFYENAKYFVDVVTTGEQVDTGTMGKTLQIIMQIMSTNPAIIQNRDTRAVLFKMMEYSGISPVDIGLLDQQIENAMQGNPAAPLQPGGSISVPSSIANPQFIPKKQMV